MARLKLKQVLSNLHYDAINDQLILSGSVTPGSYTTIDTSEETIDTFSGALDGPLPAFVISGSVEVTSTIYQTGSLTIQNIDSFGDASTPDTIDLGTY
jgi:hypothetical protein